MLLPPTPPGADSFGGLGSGFMFGDAERNSGLPLNCVLRTPRCGPTLGTLVTGSLRLEADPSLLLLSLGRCEPQTSFPPDPRAEAGPGPRCSGSSCLPVTLDSCLWLLGPRGGFAFQVSTWGLTQNNAPARPACSGNETRGGAARRGRLSGWREARARENLRPSRGWSACPPPRFMTLSSG